MEISIYLRLRGACANLAFKESSPKSCLNLREGDYMSTHLSSTVIGGNRGSGKMKPNQCSLNARRLKAILPDLENSIERIMIFFGLSKKEITIVEGNA